MGYDEEMADVNASLIGTTQQRSDQYNENGNGYNIGSDAVLVTNSNSAGTVDSNDSLIDSYKQMIKEKGVPGSAGISNNNELGVILEDSNLIAATKVEVIETKQNFDPYQKKQRDDDEFYMDSSSGDNSLVNSYKDLVTERAASVSGISSLGSNINSRNIEYQNNEGRRRNSKSSRNVSNGNSNSRDRSFRKGSDSSVMSGNLTEPDCWEEEAGYHDDDTVKPTMRGESPDIRFRKTTVCFMASLMFMLMALCAFFFSVWYNNYGVGNGGLPSLINLGRGSDKNSTLLFRDKSLSKEDLKKVQQENERLSEEIAKLVTTNQKLKDEVEDYTTLNEAWNATVIDLEGQLNMCAGNHDKAKANAELLEADATQTLKQGEEMEKRNGELLGDVVSLQGEYLILENLKDSLDISIDSLEEQVNDLSEQNGVLDATVKELENHVGDLENNNNRYQELNDQFNESISNLSDENLRLDIQVSEYANLNNELNATAYKLGSEVEKLQGEVGELEQLNDRLDASVNNLVEETENLQESNEEFNKNVDELSSQIEQLSGENDQLQASNSQLETIVGYLDQTSQNLDETYDDIMSFLAEQISAYQVLVLEGIQNTYHQSVASWDCNFADRFRSEDFSSDWNQKILPPESNMVMEYIDDRVLSNLCLSPTDFDQYVEDRYPDSKSEGITTNQLQTAVERYTMAALDYYFPDDDAVDSSLTNEDWAQAGYNCEQLPEMKHFIQFPLL